MSKVQFRIKQVKMYQAVQFEGAAHTFFTHSDYLSVRTNKSEQTLEELEDGCVLVRSAKDMIKVGFANIAFIQYDQLKPTSTSALNEAVRHDEAERAAKAKAVKDKQNYEAEALEKDKAERAAMKAAGEADAKALRDSQKAKRLEATKQG